MEEQSFDEFIELVEDEYPQSEVEDIPPTEMEIELFENWEEEAHLENEEEVETPEIEPATDEEIEEMHRQMLQEELAMYELEPSLMQDSIYLQHYWKTGNYDFHEMDLGEERPSVDEILEIE